MYCSESAQENMLLLPTQFFYDLIIGVLPLQHLYESKDFKEEKKTDFGEKIYWKGVFL